MAEGKVKGLKGSGPVHPKGSAAEEAWALPPSTREGLSALASIEGQSGTRENVAERLAQADSPATRSRRAASLLAGLQKRGLVKVKDGTFTLTPRGARLAKALAAGK